MGPFVGSLIAEELATVQLRADWGRGAEYVAWVLWRVRCWLPLSDLEGARGSGPWWWRIRCG